MTKDISTDTKYTYAIFDDYELAKECELLKNKFKEFFINNNEMCVLLNEYYLESVCPALPYSNFSIAVEIYALDNDKIEVKVIDRDHNVDLFSLDKFNNMKYEYKNIFNAGYLYNIYSFCREHHMKFVESLYNTLNSPDVKDPEYAITGKFKKDNNTFKFVISCTKGIDGKYKVTENVQYLYNEFTYINILNIIYTLVEVN